MLIRMKRLEPLVERSKSMKLSRKERKQKLKDKKRKKKEEKRRLREEKRKTKEGYKMAPYFEVFVKNSHYLKLEM